MFSVIGKLASTLDSLGKKKTKVLFLPGKKLLEARWEERSPELCRPQQSRIFTFLSEECKAIEEGLFGSHITNSML